MAEVVRHGDRWGVVETPGEPPISEHATREAALLAAGDGATVREDDPTGLDAVQDHDASEPAPGGGMPAGDRGAGDAPQESDHLTGPPRGGENPREQQGGL